MTDDPFDADPDASPPIAGSPATDLTEVVVGAMFAVLGALFWADLSTSFDLDTGFVMPILLIGIGVAGLISGRGRD